MNVRQETEEYVKDLEKCAKNLNQIVVEKASDTQDAFNVLAASSFLVSYHISIPFTDLIVRFPGQENYH